MSHDPFTAPSSNVDVLDTARGSAVKAVVLGLMTDIGGSMLSSLAFFMFYGAYLGATGGTADDLMTLARGNGIDSPMALALALVGCMFSVLGGTAARGSRSIRVQAGAGAGRLLGRRGAGARRRW